MYNPDYLVIVEGWRGAVRQSEPPALKVQSSPPRRVPLASVRVVVNERVAA